MKKLIFTIVICFFIVSLAQAFEETHKDSKHLIQAATIVFEDPTKDFSDSKENDSESQDNEQQISVLNKLKADITSFSKENNINEFYIFPFLAGLFLGPFFIAGTFAFNANHPQRKTRVKSVFIGWTWWLIIFSIILMV